jgi:hypothetical protein
MITKFVISILITLGVAANMSGQVLELSKTYLTGEDMPGEAAYVQPIELGKGIKITARTELTSKGNGVLMIKNLELRIYDAHNDAAYFQDALLKTEFADIDGDGYKDLVISGIVIYEISHVGEKMRFIREPVVFLYLYKKTEDSFRLGYKSASFTLDLESGPTQSPFYMNQGKTRSQN